MHYPKFSVYHLVYEKQYGSAMKTCTMSFHLLSISHNLTAALSYRIILHSVQLSLHSRFSSTELLFKFKTPTWGARSGDYVLFEHSKYFG